MYKRKEKQNREKSTWKNTKRKKNKKESTKDLHNSSEVVTEVGQSAAASKTNRELTHTNRDLHNSSEGVTEEGQVLQPAKPKGQGVEVQEEAALRNAKVSKETY